MGVADRPGLACVALLVGRAGVAGSAAGTCIRSLFNRAFMFLISSNFAAIVAANASAIAALLSACASAIEADAAVSLVAFNLLQRRLLKRESLQAMYELAIYHKVQPTASPCNC